MRLFSSSSTNTARRTVENGFTLVELLVTISVVAILATVAVPSFNATIRSNRVVGAANELLTMLHYARSEAIRSNALVILCASTDGSTCATTTPDNPAAILVFSSPTRGASRSVTRSMSVTEGIRMTARDDLTAELKIRPDGLAYDSNGALVSGSVDICLPGAGSTNMRSVAVSGGATVRIKPSQGVCTPTTSG